MIKKCASIIILEFFVHLLFFGINLLCNTMIQRLLYFILCTICSVILLAAICKCSSLLREEIFESVQPITTCAANRLNLTCPKDICNEQAAPESQDGTTDGFLSKIPFNICTFSSKLVKLELIYNFIYQIGNISCLLCLDTLDLSHNNIKYVGNGTFDGLTNLRVLRITHNDVITPEPSTPVGSSLQIHHADLSHNNMDVVDISNLISKNNFCEFDFFSNKITEIINTKNFKIDPTKTYKGGFLD